MIITCLIIRTRAYYSLILRNDATVAEAKKLGDTCMM